MPQFFYSASLSDPWPLVLAETVEQQTELLEPSPYNQRNAVWEAIWQADLVAQTLGLAETD